MHLCCGHRSQPHTARRRYGSRCVFLAAAASPSTRLLGCDTSSCAAVLLGPASPSDASRADIFDACSGASSASPTSACDGGGDACVLVSDSQPPAGHCLLSTFSVSEQRSVHRVTSDQDQP